MFVNILPMQLRQVVRRCRWQPTPPIPQVDVQLRPVPYSDNETALKQIHTRNIQDNMDLTRRTVPIRPTYINSINEVTETLQSVNMAFFSPASTLYWLQ